MAQGLQRKRGAALERGGTIQARLSSGTEGRTVVIRNYLTIALRSMLRHRAYALINVCGLAIGIACLMLVALYVQGELRVDRHHEHVDRIFRVLRETRRAGGESWFAPLTSGALGPALKADYPEVEEAIRTYLTNTWVRHGETGFTQAVCVADPEILNVLTLPFVKGNPGTALQEPNGVVLTEEAAERYFGDADPLGQVITVEDIHLHGDFVVTGVMADLPVGTFRADLLTSTLPADTDIARSWGTWNPSTQWRSYTVFVLLHEGRGHLPLEKKLGDTMARYMGPEEGAHAAYRLQPLSRAYLYSTWDYGRRWSNAGDIVHVYAYSGVALLVLAIACVNFVNLSTARAATRLREVGLRKVVGASRGQLVAQLLGESVLSAFLACLTGLGLASTALPSFNAFMVKELTLGAAGVLNVGGFLLGIILLTGLLAGGYPALYLSAFGPIAALRERAGPASRTGWMRKGLVVFQYGLSIVFVVGTLTVHSQLRYIRTVDLGFSREGVVEMNLFFTSRKIARGPGRNLAYQYYTVKQEFLRHPNVLKATCTRFGQGSYATMGVYTAEGSEEDWQMAVFDIDEDYLDFFGVQLLAGRNFRYHDFKGRDGRTFRMPGRLETVRGEDGSVRVTRGDQAQFLINESAVARLGWTDPVGKRFRRKNGPPGTVIGVVKDFHLRTLHSEIEPAVLTLNPGGLKWLLVKVGPGDMQETLAFLEETWKQFLPTRPFTFRFLDERLSYDVYADDIRMERVLGVLSVLAILVACLGLVGLMSFMCERRTKEIGIRKTMGESVGGIVKLLSWETVKPVLLANLVAWPVAGYLMGGWLENFAYRVPLSLWVFVLSGAAAALLALASVSFQAARAASADPVQALRYE